MAVIGHWVGAFPLCYFVPQASVALLCKMAMMSDFIASFLLLFQVESAATFPWYLSTPPPSTNNLILEWKEKGQWLPEAEATYKQGFSGFPVLFPVYLDLSYSHSVECLVFVGLAVAAVWRLRYGISIGYVIAIFLAGISHPILDMFFHDAYVLSGNRAVTRVTYNFWQIPYMEPIAYLLEILMCYGGYRIWWSTRQPLPGPEVDANITFYKRMFWTVALSHNMASFYIVSPSLIWIMYKIAPEQQFLTPACYWSYCLFAVTLWSWTFALYPLHKLESLTCRKEAATEPAEEYRKIP
ncbi:unnamed protein product [Symbiodinium natans]|uniref:Uncharacterized protein n=1 Tax=Symbiodinium natans TaxID=878477 RepID=A0A812TGS3_9DINO|nr:unnamed protein product [Symbiodinium natans]